MRQEVVERLSKGQELQNWFEEILKNAGIVYQKTGYEVYTPEHVRDMIHNDRGSYDIRYMPDYYFPKAQIFVEVKNSAALNRNQYETYCSTYPRTYILTKDKIAYYLQDIKMLALRTAPWYVEGRSYFNMDIPIEDEYWYNPKAASKTEYEKFIANHRKQGMPANAEAFGYIHRRSKSISIQELLEDLK